MSESPRIVSRVADWNEDQPLIRRIRTVVFVDEQQVPTDLEWDGLDPECVHVLAGPAMGEAVATGRLKSDGKIGRLAVLRPFRGQGYGQALMEQLIGEAVEAGMTEVYLHAQSHALAFYEGFGFTAEGPEFDEAGIPHRLMRRRLADVADAPASRSLETADDYADALVALCETARRSLVIMTHELEPSVFDRPRVLDALKAFCLSSRRASVRVLLGATEAPRHGMRFVDLARRLTSSIAVRRLPAEHERPDEAYCVADRSGVALRKQASTWKGVLYTERARIAAPRQAQFDELWEHGEPDPELRRLHL